MKRRILLIVICLFACKVHAQSVFKTPSGEKYHVSSCRMVENVSEEITVEQAREHGLLPCKICKPANIYPGNSVAVHKAQGQNSSVLCKGKTKSGSRCRIRQG